MDAVLDAVRANPVRVAAALAGLVVFVCAKVGLVVDEQSVKDAIAYLIPIVLAAEYARRKVVPVEKLTHDPALIAPDTVNRP